ILCQVTVQWPHSPRFSLLLFHRPGDHRVLRSFPTRRSSDLCGPSTCSGWHFLGRADRCALAGPARGVWQVVICLPAVPLAKLLRSEEHTSELQSRENLVCRLLLEKKKNNETATLLR